MSVTTKLNSKSNIKQISRGDLPVIPRQPVVNRYSAESTLNQTQINFGFMVDSVNAADSVMVIVDGKILTPGSTNDYTFTNVDAFGMSNQVTLTSGIPLAGLNIQVIKLGLKKETEMLQDSRFSSIYESEAAGFQAFVKTSDVITSTTATGAPVTGTFYSSISNRAPIIDPTKNLRTFMGIDRHNIEAIYPILTESGPNGEQVQGSINDPGGHCRFVGNWFYQPNVGGQQVQSGANTADFVEITFYGTGLNMLGYLNTNAFDARASVDGGAEGSNIFASGSTVFNNLNYSTNTIIPIAAGLTLGVHTVKIRNNTSGNGFNFFGYEVVNDSSLVRVSSGTSYSGSQRYINPVQQSFAHNSMVTGVRGGRVLVYQKADGTIATGWQAVNASQQNLASADHTNEEIARIFHYREFGSNSTADFSNLASTQSSRYFTLDDNTTTLVGTNVRTLTLGGLEGVEIVGGTTGSISITFVGTGLDVVMQIDGTTRQYDSVTIDGGASIGALSKTASTAKETRKIVSGLPYGTHTVSFNITSASIDSPPIMQFIVYQPKKPTLPTGAVELADYNVMATYVANATASKDTIATGVLRKSATREMTFVNGTGGTLDWTTSLATSEPVGVQVRTDRQNAYVEYTFFGTGFELRNERSTTRGNQQLMLQSLSTGGSLVNLTSTNFPTIVSSAYAATFTASTGIASFNGTATIAGGVSISNLPLGLYKVRTVNTTASVIMDPDCFDIITPIHSYKNSTVYDLQNSMTVGSQGISDNRKVSPIKDNLSKSKHVAQTSGSTSSPTTTSTSLVPMPDMSTTHFNQNGKIRITYSAEVFNSTGGFGAVLQIYVNGVAVDQARQSISAVANCSTVASHSIAIPVPVGINKVDVYWNNSGSGTATANGLKRTLLVEEAN